jgi:hypothetical protein
MRLNNIRRPPLDQIAQLFKHSGVETKSLTDEFELHASGFTSIDEFCMAARKIAIASKSGQRTMDREIWRIVLHLAGARAEVEKVLDWTRKFIGLNQAEHCQNIVHCGGLSKAGESKMVLSETDG